MTDSHEFDVQVNLDENCLTIVERREIDELFDERGRLQLWTAPTGWRGYRREQTESGFEYYYIDTTRDSEDWTAEVRVSEEAVVDAVAEHVADTDAGQFGHFERGAPAAADEAQGRPICQYCGTWIDEPGQRCPALDDGRCEP